jgi:hypothetical protein
MSNSAILTQILATLADLQASQTLLSQKVASSILLPTLSSEVIRLTIVVLAL